MQQGDSVTLLPGFSSQFSQPQDYYSRLNGYGDGTNIDTSFSAYQNATIQYPVIPDTAWNTTIQTHNGRTPVIDKNLYCTWPGCPQSYKGYTAAKLKKHWKTHTKPEQCPFYPENCTWEGTAEKRELQEHIKNNHQRRSNPSFTCSNCAKRFTAQKNLTRHQKICYAKNPPEVYYGSLVWYWLFPEATRMDTRCRVLTGCVLRCRATGVVGLRGFVDFWNVLIL